MEKEFRLEIADNKEEYEGLRTLWCEVFSDEPSFVDAMYANFGEGGIHRGYGYVVDEEGGVLRSDLLYVRRLLKADPCIPAMPYALTRICEDSGWPGGS